MKRKEHIVFQKYHPLVIFLYLLGGIGVSMCTMHPVILLLSLGMMSVYGSLWIGKIFWIRLIGLGIPIAVFSVILMPLFSHRGETAVLYINDMPVTQEMICYGMTLLLLLLAVFAWFQLAAFLCDQEKILYLFGKVLPKFGLLLAMVFRLVPLMGQRFREIHDAQKCLGVNTKDKSLPEKVGQFTKELSILISWFLEESMERAISMESRGYGVKKRTSFCLFHWGTKDGVVFVMLMLLYGITLWQLLIGAYQSTFFPTIRMVGFSWESIGGGLSFGIAMLMPAIIEIMAMKARVCPR